MSFLAFFIRRLGFTLVATWVAISLNFLLPRMMPGDPAEVIFGQSQGKMKPETLEKLRESMGFGQGTIIEQYVSYLSSTLQGDLGRSLTHSEPVSSIIGDALLWSIFLAGGAMIIAFTIGTLLGIACAWKRGSWLDDWVPPVLSFIGAFPYFFLAMVALSYLGFQQGWFPIRHAYSDGLSPQWSFEFAHSVAVHAILPAGTMVLVGLGGWTLSMRNNMIATLGEDYIAFARARGLNSRWIMLRYAAQNAILPNLTGFGMALGFVVGGALLTEIVFSYPGQGYLLLEAVNNKDYFLMQGIFLTITLAALGANLMVDLLTFLYDPRTRRSL